ncbi:hypothetical protein [Hyalangium versicolor]|uniref:hypothetical protein n=1 Tax=Hyalangium versicolor TaxID=2861190 RepID=UPI001CCDC7DE|nr:hypothetical protein [Hyalangium versicolor]
MKRAVLLLLWLSLPIQALAQAPEPVPEAPSRRLVLNSMLVARVNPLGLESQTRVGYQARLYRKEGMLFRDNFLFLGAYPKINPASIKVGPVVELQPLSMLNLRLSAEYVGFFGTQGFLQSRPSPNAEYSETVLDAGAAVNEQYGTSGAHLAFEPLVQLKVGPIAVRNRFGLEYWSMSLREGDRVWYDATLDTLVPGKGFTLANDLDVLFMGAPPLVVGARYSLVQPLYTPRHLADGEAETQENGHHRLGLLAAYVFYDEGYTAFNKPAIILNVAWYLRHRYRTGVEVSRAVPYALLGFAFQSDLLDGT